MSRRPEGNQGLPDPNSNPNTKRTKKARPPVWFCTFFRQRAIVLCTWFFFLPTRSTFEVFPSKVFFLPQMFFPHKSCPTLSPQNQRSSLATSTACVCFRGRNMTSSPSMRPTRLFKAFFLSSKKEKRGVFNFFSFFFLPLCFFSLSPEWASPVSSV